ncbi:beta-lactamase [Opitutaceae bacterium TAV5]|nr:beta-lactamase [Opitutaceae bacterium TAV5]
MPVHRFPVSDHCDGFRFFNARDHVGRNLADVLRWKFAGQREPWPARVNIAPVAPPPPPERGWRATWVNHATFLLQSPAGNLLTDPVWGDRCGPLGLSGPRRVHPPGVAFGALPRIDAVLLSHDHYDHCDLATLRRLWRAHRPLAITPLGNGALLRRAGFTPGRIVELDWWQAHLLPATGEGGGGTEGIRITVTPAHHWSNRLSGGRNGRLWGGFYAEPGLSAAQGERAGREATLYFAGDTGYEEGLFQKIRERLGAPDLALLPIGAYAPRWFMSVHHCDPADAVRIHRELGARQSVAMHWGTFQLTDEGREAPPQELAAALAEAGEPAERFVTLTPGGSVDCRSGGFSANPPSGRDGNGGYFT